MLATLLRLTYLSQALLGAWAAWAWLPAWPSWLAALAGALALPLFIHSLSIAVGFWLSLRAQETQVQPRHWSKLARAMWGEWRAALQVFMLRQTGRACGPGQIWPATSIRHNNAAFAPVPVLLVHGHFCNHRVWDDMAASLRAQGHAVMAIDLEPLFGSIDDYADQIECAASQLCDACGHTRIALLGHSMGGLAIRAWMRAHGTAKVKQVLTLGSPHRGTHLAKWSLSSNGRQMIYNSDWLQSLAESESPEIRSLIHIGLTDTDSIVYPSAAQTLDGCQVTRFEGLGHLELCLHAQTLNWVCQMLAPPPSTIAGAADVPAMTSMHQDAVARPDTLGELFWAFAWMALQGFGGVLSVVQRELVERKKWLTQTQFIEDWSVSQILPGPNVVNLALMMGDRYFGWRGGLVAMAGIISLPMLLVLMLGVAFSGVADVPEVKGALRGMGAVAAGMIAANGLKLMHAFRSNVLGLRLTYAMALATFCSAAFLRLPLIWTLLGIGGLSCTLAFIQLRQQPHDRQV
jgi:chromate transport protein ChrA/pimeloyl-ACP methyl ester carboxylesterase